MSSASFQDGQIFKERCEESPGILIFCQGDWWHPTPERVALLERANYLVMTAANGRADIPFWLPHPRCIGCLFGDTSTANEARHLYPGKIIENFEGVSARFLRNISQEMPFSLHYAGVPFTATAPKDHKTVDVVSSFSPVALKRGHLLMETLINSGVSAYVFAHTLGSDQSELAKFLEHAKRSQCRVEFFHLPFDPYALIRIDDRIVIDCRPIGANSPIVSSYLARARLYLHTSTTEGFSNAIMEALHNDVPVLLCEDILGPLQNMSYDLPECFTRAQATPENLGQKIKQIIAQPPERGQVKAAFDRRMNPFELNRRIVLATQAWFARQGLPWKGHCLGIFGGVQSKLDLADVTAEQSYRGSFPIYSSPEMARQFIGFHANIALQKGRKDLLIPLIAELESLNW